MEQQRQTVSYLRITDGKGFSIQFDNGWSVSVQFGSGNYADNYDEREQPGESRADMNRRIGEQGSRTAECAVFDPSGEFVNLKAAIDRDDDVSNRSDAAEVLRLLNWAAAQSEAS